LLLLFLLQFFVQAGIQYDGRRAVSDSPVPVRAGSVRPVPRGCPSLPVLNRSKMSGSRSAGMPPPVSATMILAGIPG
jgi:hypothetical protein